MKGFLIDTSLREGDRRREREKEIDGERRRETERESHLNFVFKGYIEKEKVEICLFCLLSRTIIPSISYIKSGNLRISGLLAIKSPAHSFIKIIL